MTRQPQEPDDLMHREPGGARWCEEHRRFECTRKAKNNPAGICHGSRVAGLDRCRIHAGQSGEVAKFRGEVALTLAEQLEAHPHRHPAEVLLGCVHLADVLLAVARNQVTAESEVTAESLERLRSALDQAARWAEATLKLDVASREARVFEQVGAVYAASLNRVLDRLELTSEQRARVPEVVRAELAAIETGKETQ